MPPRAVHLNAPLARGDPNAPVGRVLRETTPIERRIVIARQKTVRLERTALLAETA
ncbi:MAG: hypothetical protein JSR66_32585 [Proteobacteria bacterium]|nr:hypothetical protein [Pseudomonadota bacterium]